MPYLITRPYLYLLTHFLKIVSLVLSVPLKKVEVSCKKPVEARFLVQITFAQFSPKRPKH